MLKKNSYTQIMFGSLFFGIIVGFFLNYFSYGEIYFLKIISDLFIKLIKMVVIPLVFFTIVYSISELISKNLKKLTISVLIYFALTTVLASTFGIIISLFINPGNSFDKDLIISTSEKLISNYNFSIYNSILNIVPSNPIEAFSEGNIIQIIFFSIFFGLCIGKLKLDRVKYFFKDCSDIMCEMTKKIMLLAPVGVFSLIVNFISINGFDLIFPFLKLIFVMYLTCVLYFILVYLILIKISNFSIKIFLKLILTPFLIAFSTCSSIASLSSNIISSRNMNVDNKLVDFILPLGNAINMDGTAIYMGITTIFIMSIYNINFDINSYFVVVFLSVLASLGTIGIPGTAIVMLSTILIQLNIPMDIVGLLFGIDRFMDMPRTSINIIGDSVGAVFLNNIYDKK